MKVKELIERLGEFDPEMDVLCFPVEEFEEPAPYIDRVYKQLVITEYGQHESYTTDDYHDPNDDGLEVVILG